jgi:putative ABC transport system permease protein
MSASEKFFRLLLRLYPVDFRDEFGDALVQTYIDRSRDGRPVRVWFAAVVDSLRNGLGERLRPAVAWRRGGDWGRDLELVTRRFRQKPWFTATVICTLTVGLGIFAVVYTAIDKILLEPLPYKDSGDLYKPVLDIDYLSIRAAGLKSSEIVDLERSGGPIEDLAVFDCGNGAIPATDNRDAFHINMMVASPNLFDLLGSPAALGRVFRRDEYTSEAIVLSDAMWRRLGAYPEIVGSKLRIGGVTHTVVGVMKPGFGFTCATASLPDVYVPVSIPLSQLPPDNYDLNTIMRVHHGTSAAAASRAVQAFNESYPQKRRGVKMYAVGLQTDLVKQVRPALLALAFAGIFLILVLTVNLASLLLARAAEREKEFAVSRALGGSGPAVVRATLLEGGLLGFIGGVAGVLIGIWGARLLVAIGPLDLPRRDTIALDPTIAIIVITAGIVLGFTAATVPAAWAARVSLGSLISASAVRGGASSSRMRRGLVVVQVALSLVLLSTGGLVVRSFQRLLAADPGFRPDGVLTLRLSTRVLTKAEDVRSFHDRVTAELQRLPGVTHVSATSALPLSGGQSWGVIKFPGAPGNTGDVGDKPFVDRVFTRAGYVQTMGMKLLAGRDFEEPHRAGIKEALIDQYLAKQFFPNSSPLGQTVVDNDAKFTIIGVVQQARMHDLHKDGRSQVFYSADEFPPAYSFYVIRTDKDPHALISGARSVIRQIERRIPVSMMFTMDEIVADARSRERISAALTAGLALGALLLVSMGLFGMISGSVARRSGELAVRLALGATHGNVIRLVVGEGARLIFVGLLIGIPGIYMAGEAIRGFLILASPFDGPTLVVVVSGLTAVALLACYLAARRVTAIDPDRLLREGR